MVWPGKGSRRASAQAKSLPQSFALALLSLKFYAAPTADEPIVIPMPIGTFNLEIKALPKAKIDVNAPVTTRIAALKTLSSIEDSHL